MDMFLYILALYTLLPATHGINTHTQSDNPVPGVSTNETQAINLIERLLNKLDNRVRPNIYGPPLRVACDFYVQSFGSIDEVNMDFEINVFFRQRWYDDRLKFTDQDTPVVVPFRYIDRFWLPDIFFPNEKSASFHNVVVPNQVIKIFPDGLVRYSVRMTLKLACPMYLLNFPLDYQDCFLKVSSYSYTEADVVLAWLQPHPLEINTAELSLPQFELLKNYTGRCEESLSTGSFSCLKATFSMKRQVGFYVLQTYIPSMLIVSLSWVSFWISKDAVPARITLGVTTVLTMTTQLSSSRSATMKVSYPKAIDVWYAFCMLLVFAALVEYAFVNVLVRREEPEKKKRPGGGRSSRAGGVLATGPFQAAGTGAGRKHQDPEDPCDELLNDKTVIELDEYDDEDGIVDGGEDGLQRGSSYSRKHRVHAGEKSMESPSSRLPPPHAATGGIRCGARLTADGLDKCSRICFPLCFFFFNVLYWAIYTQPTVFTHFA